MVTLSNCVEELMKDDLIHQAYVYSDRSSKFWRLVKDVEVELSDGTRIVIPQGFFYDMASVPKIFWSIARPFNDGLLATLIHDYLYVHRQPGWGLKKVDREYLIWMNATNKNKLDNYVRYYIVRALGWLVWYRIFIL